MRIFKLDGRLSLCAYYVRRGSRLADIGTDHAYLPVWLMLNGIIKNAVACDINEKPLESGGECVEKYALKDKIELRLSDGLQKVDKDEVDDIVIAGMGGELIEKIIADCDWIKDKNKHLILQPMTKHEQLIDFLYKNGFEIESQKACCAEKKYYTVISAYYTGKTKNCGLSELCIGKLDANDEMSQEFIKMTLNHLRKRALGDPAIKDEIKKLETVIK